MLDCLLLLVTKKVRSHINISLNGISAFFFFCVASKVGVTVKMLTWLTWQCWIHFLLMSS